MQDPTHCSLIDYMTDYMVDSLAHVQIYEEGAAAALPRAPHVICLLAAAPPLQALAFGD